MVSPTKAFRYFATGLSQSYGSCIYKRVSLVKTSKKDCGTNTDCPYKLNNII